MDKLKKVPMVTTESVKTSTVSKWIPMICAGAAAGVSIIALQEIKKVRAEISTIKKNQTPDASGELSKRMESMELQLKVLTDFIKNKDRVSKESEVIRNVVKEQPTVQIINGDEYEEIEVTDDEESETEIEEKNN